MTTDKYKGFRILARPYQLYDSMRWTVDLEIHRYGERQRFSLDERYQTEQEADTRCTSLGRLIIDGEVPGWSVDHLRACKREPRRQLVVAGIAILGLGVFLLLRGTSFTPGLALFQATDLRLRFGQWKTVLGGVAVAAAIVLIAVGAGGGSGQAATRQAH